MIRLILVYLFCFSTIVSVSQRKSFEFNGSTSYIDCGNINLTGNKLTIMGWINVKSFKTGHPFITSLFGIESAPNQALLRLGDAGQGMDQVQFVFYFNGSPVKLNGNIKLKTNTWHHVAGIYDGSTMKIYVDGVLDVSQVQTGSFTANAKFEIGRNYASSRIMDGYIDEVSVFKKALTQTEIRDWICRRISSSHPQNSSLEAYWSLDSKTSSSTSDLSGKGHTGTLISSPTHSDFSAPVGDESVYSFSSSNTSLNISTADNDTFKIDSISGSPASSHLYLVTEKANGSSLPSGFSKLDSTRYWGVHFVGGTAVKYDLVYQQDSNKNLAYVNPCNFNLLQRTASNAVSWNAPLTVVTKTTISLNNQSAGEYVLGFDDGLLKTLKPSSKVTICGSDSVRLWHATTGLSYQWLKNGVLLPNDTNNELYTNVADNYSLVVSAGACTDTTEELTAIGKQKPNVTLAPYAPVCEDAGFVNLVGGLPIGGKYDTPHRFSGRFAVSSSGVGSFPIEYSLKDTNGCTGIAVQNLIVNPIPNVIINPLPKICEGGSGVNLNFGQPLGGTYYIDSVKETKIRVAVLGAGTFDLIYHVSKNGCSSAATETIVINGKPIIATDIKDTVCEGSATFVLKNGFPGGGAFTGVGVSANVFDPSVAGVGLHRISYNYTDTITTCSAIDTNGKVWVMSKPLIPTITENSNDSLISSLSKGNQWFDSIGAINNATSQIYTPTYDGKYYIINTSDFGCISDTSDLYSFKINAVIDTGDGGKDTSDGGGGTGIFELSNGSAFKIYPNPATQQIQLLSLTGSIGKVALFNNIGKLVYNLGTFDESFKIIDLERLNINEGAYFLVRQGSKSVSVKKLIIVE